MHLELLGLHCRLCGKIAQIETCCSNPKCVHAKTGVLAAKGSNAADLNVVGEAEY